MTINYDSKKNQIYCTNAFLGKEVLKEYGFRFNGINKSWFLPMPKTGIEIGNLICDLFTRCDVDFWNLSDFFFGHLPKEIAETIGMDEAHQAAWNAATGKYYE